ncbi:MAG: hypothetical protein SFV20_13265 [Sphingopyxis sp.]|nr:hypothetical protein [Sphingopyxis sp.]
MTNNASPLMGLSALFLAAALTSASLAAAPMADPFGVSKILSAKPEAASIRDAGSPAADAPQRSPRKNKRTICPAPRKTAFACTSKRQHDQDGAQQWVKRNAW